MKQYTIETPDGYKAVETKVDNGILIRFVEEEKYEPKKEKFEPKDGDVLFFGDDIYTWIGIYGKKSNDESNPYMLYSFIGRKSEYRKWTLDIEYKPCREPHNPVRLATPEEQKLLFYALAKAGKMWNSDKKEIVDIPKKGDILKWTGVMPFVGVVTELEELYPCYATIFNPAKDREFDKLCCWMPNLVKPTDSEKQECLANLKRLGKKIDENGDIVDIKLLVPDNIHIWRSREDFGYDQLFIGFNEDKQLLGYNHKFNTWVVYSHHDGYDRVQCELVEVKREELKDGDLVCNVGGCDDIYNYSIWDNGTLLFSGGEHIEHNDSTDETKYKLKPING